MTRLFGAESTADDALDGADLTGKRFLVTGVSSGIGAETARALVTHGASVIGTVPEAQQALEASEALSGAGDFRLEKLDLGCLDDVNHLAQRLLADGQTIDAIIANAGVMASPQRTTAEGFEIHFGTNHIGHFVLVTRLLPLLGPSARVVTLSSAVHGLFDIDLDDPNMEHTPYHEVMAYGRSKTASILFAVELDRRLRNRGIRAAAVHPGAIRTNLTRHMTPDVVQRLSQFPLSMSQGPASEINWKTIAQGAATSVWAACVAPAETIGGRYCADCGLPGTAADRSMTANEVQPYAIDPVRAAALWELSERMVQSFLKP